jgi:hypothetical protein
LRRTHKVVRHIECTWCHGTWWFVVLVFPCRICVGPTASKVGVHFLRSGTGPQLCFDRVFMVVLMSITLFAEPPLHKALIIACRCAFSLVHTFCVHWAQLYVLSMPLHITAVEHTISHGRPHFGSMLRQDLGPAGCLVFGRRLFLDFVCGDRGVTSRQPRAMVFVVVVLVGRKAVLVIGSGGPSRNPFSMARGASTATNPQQRSS